VHHIHTSVNCCFPGISSFLRGSVDPQMWYNPEEEGEDEVAEEGEVPLLESGRAETESDRPTVLETFILAVDESLSLLLHWSAKNWKLDGDFVDSEKEEEEDEQILDMESHVGSHALPLLKVVRKYLKKVERTLRGALAIMLFQDLLTNLV